MFDEIFNDDMECYVQLRSKMIYIGKYSSCDKDYLRLKDGYNSTSNCSFKKITFCIKDIEAFGVLND